ncbi:regulator of nonsense transcripts 3B isoform X4 [Rhipicephalus sanguineus]|uniref:regulator of nonsense transcripts 3B isoform X4 n=1 Tax=Rhipicephalus sanguineus TaxID=34632 RepID=UPI0018936053|nr:regulator of nonsense transcripts 3B isoform X4 [Rhipicephalus sanguineus]
MTQEKAKDECSPRSRSSSEASKSKEKKERPFLTKVVVRRLPPTMTEEQFLEQISPVPESDYMYFVKGDLSLGPHAFSRAYINFVNQDEIFIFKEKFDDYIFVDEKGNEYPALVEYAPFQKIPKRRTRKKDPKCGTIEQDPEYIKFLESLEQPEEVTLPSIDTYIEEIEARDKEIKANNGCLKVVTPLIEYLQQRKLEKLVLRNPVREHEPPSATTAKDSGTGVVPKSSAGTGGSHSKAPPVRSSMGGGSNARKDWERPKVPRPSKDYQGPKEYSKHKSEQPASSHSRRGSTGSDGRGQEAGAPKASATTPATDDERTIAEGSRGAAPSTSTPAEGKNASSEKDRERPSAHEESSQSRTKDPRAERRIRNKDRPSIEIYRPGMRRLSQKATSAQEESPSAGTKPSKSANSSSKPPT